MQRNLNISNKTGFRITDINTPVNIRDERGIIFYSTEAILPVESFNLPPGNYLVDNGYFKPMTLPLIFKKEKLPMAEQAVPVSPSNFEIVFEKNPNKCTIFWKEKIMVFDPYFQECPLPQFYFIYFHEWGHGLYGYGTLYTAKEAEAYCDLYASNKMLDMGFNPSQIMIAPKETLSENANYRKNFIDTVLLNNA